MGYVVAIVPRVNRAIKAQIDKDAGDTPSAWS